MTSMTKNSYSRFYTNIAWTWNFELMRCESAFNVNQCNVPNHHGLCSLFHCTQSLLSAIVSSLPCLSPLSFPVTGNSHNCRPKCLSICRRQRGQAWLRLNTQFQGEFVSHRQTKDAVPHLRGATYTENRRSRTWIQLSLELCLWSWQLGKNVRPATAANKMAYLEFRVHGFKVLLVTV